ncbi:hypothetical protein SD81_029125 [Tolypothrix campylonemoides VB511288]|nr:hypothetical protein SD81_029125 [Tolypothrix campylonemoides VB511288]
MRIIVDAQRCLTAAGGFPSVGDCVSASRTLRERLCRAGGIPVSAQRRLRQRVASPSGEGRAAGYRQART